MTIRQRVGLGLFMVAAVWVGALVHLALYGYATVTL